MRGGEVGGDVKRRRSAEIQEQEGEVEAETDRQEPSQRGLAAHRLAACSILAKQLSSSRQHHQ